MPTPSATPSDPSAWPSATGETGRIRAFGPVIVARCPLGGTLRAAVVDGSRRDAVALCLPGRRALGWRRGDALIASPPGGGLLVELGDGGEFAEPAGVDGLLLVLPRRAVPAIQSGMVLSSALQRSSELDTLGRLASALLGVEARLSEAQGRLAGSALTEMLTAVLLPLGPAYGLRPLREATLLDRIVDHLDARLGEPVDVAALCRALNCSRSALYRAAAPAGGIVALVNQRRLAAVRDRLCDPNERASIAALALEHGFADAAGFSHRFKRHYGVTAGQLRGQNKRNRR